MPEAEDTLDKLDPGFKGAGRISPKGGVMKMWRRAEGEGGGIYAHPGDF